MRLGIDVNTKHPETGSTALHTACEHEMPDVARHLIVCKVRNSPLGTEIHPFMKLESACMPFMKLESACMPFMKLESACMPFMKLEGTCLRGCMSECRRGRALLVQAEQLEQDNPKPWTLNPKP
jgi:hypothetical protein